MTSRGWYRIDPKTCLHPDVTGQPKQIFSFAEAIDADNRAIKLKDKPLNWGGDKQLCTRETKFETNEQTDCGARGFARDGFWRGGHEQRRQDAALCDAVIERVVMKSPRTFAHVDTWVFDLDNTLYPHHVNLWQQVDARIGEFVCNWLKVGPEEARKIQKDYYQRFGTTMRGMMTLHGVRADDYLAYVHKIDHSPLEPNPALGEAIAKLSGRKLILTNGSVDHVDAVLARLGLGSHFDGVFDIIAAEFEPKPAAQTYQKFLGDHAVDPTQSRHVRGPRPQPHRPARARHDHRAGGA